jgi:hypothetical protein
VTQPQDPTQPAGAPVSDEQLVQALTRITAMFCGGLVIVLLAGVLFIVEDPTVRITGLALGVLLGLASWFVPVVVIRSVLAKAASAAAQPDGVAQAQTESDGAAGVVRAAAMVGLACAETPAMLALVFAVVDGHDVGALVIAVPVAIASLIFNVSGPAAVRRHLARLRSPITL